MKTDLLLKDGGTSVKDFIAALLEPLQTMTNGLKTFETNAKKTAKFNGQKMVLQAALNDTFGVLAAPYIIVETVLTTGEDVFFYEPSELIPQYFYEPSENDPLYFFEPEEISEETADFIVKIPVGIYTAELERRVRAETNKYKLAGKTFTIITY